MRKEDYLKPVIGLVGGVGAGKSTVAAEFVRLGCAAIDGDAIGHELLSDADVQRQLRARWGEAIFLPSPAGPPQVNRRALAAVVFNEPTELDALNRILHPAIRSRIQSRIEAHQNDQRYRGIVLDAAIMLEAGWDELCTTLVFVSASPADRLARVSAARGWDEAAWRAREKSQIPLDKKAQRCNDVVDNSSSVSRLREQVCEIFRKVVHAAGRP